VLFGGVRDIGSSPKVGCICTVTSAEYGVPYCTSHWLGPVVFGRGFFRGGSSRPSHARYHHASGPVTSGPLSFDMADCVERYLIDLHTAGGLLDQNTKPWRKVRAE
jgi:hypothetical protein